MKNSINSRAFKLAHQIKSTFKNFSQALRAAWMIVKLQAGVRTPIQFAKDTGEVREAVAIACGSLSTIEKGFLKFVEWVNDEKTQWRSFRIERLILS